MSGTKTLAEVKKGFLGRSSDNQKLWDETESKRALGMTLAQYRAEKRLSQTDVAERAGWDKAFVSRLEGAQGGYPETATLKRYVEACGAYLVVGVLDSENFQTGRVRVLCVMSGPADSTTARSTLSARNNDMSEWTIDKAYRSTHWGVRDETSDSEIFKALDPDQKTFESKA